MKIVLDVADVLTIISANMLITDLRAQLASIFGYLFLTKNLEAKLQFRIQRISSN